MQVKTFLRCGSAAWRAVLLPCSARSRPRLSPSPSMWDVAPLCSDKALRTQKKCHAGGFCELCFKENQLKSAEKSEWLRGYRLICDHHRLTLYSSSGQNLWPFLVPRVQSSQGNERTSPEPGGWKGEMVFPGNPRLFPKNWDLFIPPQIAWSPLPAPLQKEIYFGPAFVQRYPSIISPLRFIWLLKREFDRGKHCCCDSSVDWTLKRKKNPYCH